PALARKCVTSLEDIHDRNVPHPRELGRKSSRRDVAALPRALGVARHGYEAVHYPARDDARDERRGLTREPALTTLLPRTNECPGVRVVDDRRARRGERESPS
ncbi:MAG TPA: hypothetical protein VJK00_12320, partial [Steroidobacteraceae bacterium]|nr:hypothetical protein [Steroidobacteraceae bacterium]